MAVEDWGENLRALGASFGGRHWPLSEEQIRVVETKVGWQLPSDYRRYLSETGLSGVQGRRGFVSAAHSTGIQLSVIYGHHPRDHMYSIITLADQFLEPDPILQIAAGDAGAFYMTESGAILFESNWERGLTPLTQSFTEFMDGIEALR